MDETNFCKNFSYNIGLYDNYHLTDNTKEPIKSHFFGYLISGTAEIKTKNSVLLLEPNDVFYIPKGIRYQSQWFAKNNEQIKFYSFGFKISPMNKTYVLQKINCSDKAKKILDELCEEIPITEKGIGKLYYFFGEVIDRMQPSKKNKSNPIIEKAIEVLTENPSFKISEVAHRCDVSESGLYLVFKKHLNKTPNDIRLEILCEKAVTLLSTTNKSVQEISDTLDFCSTSYFRKVLKAHTGKSPLGIRKESLI